MSMPLSNPSTTQGLSQPIRAQIDPPPPCVSSGVQRPPEPEPSRPAPWAAGPSAPEPARPGGLRHDEGATAGAAAPSPRGTGPQGVEPRGEEGEPAQERDASDEELLAAYIEGDREAFALLFERHHNRLYKAVWSVLSHHQDVEDALQETFARAAHRARQFRGEASLTTWLGRIAINTALSQLDARQRLADPVEPTHKDLAVGPRGVVASVEGLVVLEDAVRRLSYRLREPFVLRLQRGLSTDEIAELLDIPRNTVLSRVFRARERLAAMLEDSDDPDGHP